MRHFDPSLKVKTQISWLVSFLTSASALPISPTNYFSNFLPIFRLSYSRNTVASLCNLFTHFDEIKFAELIIRKYLKISSWYWCKTKDPSNKKMPRFQWQTDACGARVESGRYRNWTVSWKWEDFSREVVQSKVEGPNELTMTRLRRPLAKMGVLNIWIILKHILLWQIIINE